MGPSLFTGSVSPFSASLYCHIPFCTACCDYCDFYSIPLPGLKDDRRLPIFVDALVADAEAQIRRFAVRRIPTVYIGGGTPSVLGAAGIERLLRGLKALWAGMDEGPEEISLEINPESAGEDLLRAARDGGVNRISLGVQSFHGPSRRAVHRRGSPGALPPRLQLAAEIFPGSFSVDLMAGLPFQNEAVLLRDIETLLAYCPAHVSLYALTLEEGSPLGVKARSSPGFLPLPEEADRIWIAGRDALENSGYPQYEVSNFSPPEKWSRHNIRYWRMESWLGAGPSASGTLIDEETGTGRRYTVPAETESWLSGRGRPEPAEEFLDSLTLMKESLLMGFRFTGGPSGELFARRFGLNIGDTIPRTISAWRKRGFFAGEALAPSREGLLFLDPFLRDAFGELETGQKKSPLGERGPGYGPSRT